MIVCIITLIIVPNWQEIGIKQLKTQLFGFVTTKEKKFNMFMNKVKYTALIFSAYCPQKCEITLEKVR